MTKIYPPRKPRKPYVTICECGHSFLDHITLNLLMPCEVCQCWRYRDNKEEKKKRDIQYKEALREYYAE